MVHHIYVRSRVNVHRARHPAPSAANALVHPHRHYRRHGGAHSCDLPTLPGLDRGGAVAGRRARGSARRCRVPRADLRLRAQHEFGHIVAARRYGIRTPEVTLWPIGGVASLERLPDKPSEELVVALAGPAVNVAIAAALMLVMGTGPDDAALRAFESPRAGLVPRLAAANIFLVVFNLIPAFPMDGGRVLRALLAMRLGRAEATRIAARIGQGAAFLFALAGLFANPMLILIGLFIYLAATAEAQHVAFNDGNQDLPVSAAMVSAIESLSPSSTLDDAVDLMLRTSQHEFPVLDGARRPRGLLTRDGLIVALRQGGPATPVLDVMTRNLPFAGNREPFEAALAKLNTTKAPALFILDESGRMVGLLTPENVGEMMLVRSVKPDWHFRRSRTAAPSTP